MLSHRLKQLRLARGLSLEALTAKMGGIVTKQALSKYEQGKSQPSREVLNKLADALGVKAAYLWSDPQIHVELIAYRKGSRLLKREQQKIESFVVQALEERIRLQDLLTQINDIDVPVQGYTITCVEDVEQAAKALRERWDLGLDPIARVVDVLEGHYVHVLEIRANEKFDGIAVVARDQDQQVKATAVVTRQGVPGERQRFNLAHELGHLVLKMTGDVDEEKAAYRFGAAFLTPAQVIQHAVGTRRSYIQIPELLLLKKRFGMSVQALLFRLRDLDILTESSYKQGCIHMNRLGWRKHEPGELPPEQPQWLSQSLLRALSEEVITREEAEQMIGEPLAMEPPLSLVERRAFLKLPLEERRRILEEQAKRTVQDYEEERTEWAELQGGDLIES